MRHATRRTLVQLRLIAITATNLEPGVVPTPEEAKDEKACGFRGFSLRSNSKHIYSESEPQVGDM